MTIWSADWPFSILTWPRMWPAQAASEVEMSSVSRRRRRSRGMGTSCQRKAGNTLAMVVDVRGAVQPERQLFPTIRARQFFSVRLDQIKQGGHDALPGKEL